METSASRTPLLRDSAPGYRPARRVAQGLVGPVRSGLSEAGQIGTFIWRTVVELRGVWRYTSEILRQVGALITGSALVIVGMTFVVGLFCGSEADYVMRGYGAIAYSGVFTSFCFVREMLPTMFAYIFAAKVGCGMCAEIGGMRIQEELDALEAVGLNPYRYVIATRLVAALLCLPLLFWLAAASGTLGIYLIIVVQIGEVSPAGWGRVHWAFSTPLDFLYSFIRVMSVSTMILFVAMYFGYNAKGGPVGVGTATARSMIVNLVLLHLLLGGLVVLFWGGSPNTPIGG